MQLRRGAVSVSTGFATVRGVYVAALTSVVGTFLPGEQLRWGATGAGICVRHDTIASKAYFTRSSGAAPVAGDGLRNIPSTKTSTIASLASDSTPNFSTELAGPGGPKIFTVQESGVFYNITSEAADSFELAGNYGGTTDPESAYVIVRDFTPHFNWPIPGAGDIDLASIIGQLAVRIDQAVWGGLKLGVTFGTNWANAPGLSTEFWANGDRTVSLSGAGRNVINTVPHVMLTLPVGYRPLYERHFPTAKGHEISINIAGQVTVLTGLLNDAVYVDGINFRAET